MNDWSSGLNLDNLSWCTQIWKCNVWSRGPYITELSRTVWFVSNLARLPAILFQEGRYCSASQTQEFFCPMESTVKTCKERQKRWKTRWQWHSSRSDSWPRDSSIGSLEGQSQSDVSLWSFFSVLLLKRSTIQPGLLQHTLPAKKDSEGKETEKIKTRKRKDGKGKPCPIDVLYLGSFRWDWTRPVLGAQEARALFSNNSRRGGGNKMKAPNFVQDVNHSTPAQLQKLCFQLLMCLTVLTHLHNENYICGIVGTGAAALPSEDVVADPAKIFRPWTTQQWNCTLFARPDSSRSGPS